MNSIILCEGSSDFVLLQYYMRRYLQGPILLIKVIKISLKIQIFCEWIICPIIVKIHIKQAEEESM